RCRAREQLGRSESRPDAVLGGPRAGARRQRARLEGRRAHQPGPDHADPGEVDAPGGRQPGAEVRLPLPHPGARGQLDDAAAEGRPVAMLSRHQAAARAAALAALLGLALVQVIEQPYAFAQGRQIGVLSALLIAAALAPAFLGARPRNGPRARRVVSRRRGVAAPRGACPAACRGGGRMRRVLACVLACSALLAVSAPSAWAHASLLAALPKPATTL